MFCHIDKAKAHEGPVEKKQKKSVSLIFIMYTSSLNLRTQLLYLHTLKKKHEDGEKKKKKKEKKKKKVYLQCNSLHVLKQYLYECVLQGLNTINCALA